MDIVKILSSGAALIFVLCLIALGALVFRKYMSGSIGLPATKASKKRLQLKEVLNIDARKKIVLIAKDEKEYLVAFSDNDIEVIDK